mgnify:CR=1 FL=1
MEKPKTIFKEEKLSLSEAQKLIDGHIEIAYDDGKTQIVCNEEGKLFGLPYNKRATFMWASLLGGIPNDHLVGDVLILTKKARLL